MNRAQYRVAAREAAIRAQKCANGGPLEGTVRMKLLSDGHVGDIVVSTPSNDPALTSCIVESFASMQIAPFEGGPFPAIRSLHVKPVSELEAPCDMANRI